MTTNLEMPLKIGCLPYAGEKQPSIPLINLGRKWTLSAFAMYIFIKLGTSIQVPEI